jgi:hypothetical protein
MKTWQLAVVALLWLALAGCRTDPEIARLEHDNRIKEDEIYRLRDQLEDCQADLQEAQRRAASQGPRRTESAPQPGPDLSPAPGGSEPSTAPRTQGNGRVEPGNIEAPSVEMPKEAEPKGKIPKRFQVPGPAPASGSQPPDDSSQPGATPAWNQSTAAPAGGTATTVAARRAADSSGVTRITLNQPLTGGLAAADRPGDQGLMVVIEPRDAQGQLLDAPGDVQIVALDPALAGPAGRAGRWEFTAAQTAALPRGPDRGIHLNLPWPDGPPAHHKLHLFVRYLTSDGRRLETDSLIDVALPGDPVMPAWAPAVRLPDSPAQSTASGSSSPSPPRPVWSPERL